MTLGTASLMIAGMRGKSRHRRLGRALAVAGVSALGLISAPHAIGTVADEEHRGAALVQAVASGERDYDSLSAKELERIGEYWMGRMQGSTQAHEAMNARMRQMMGPAGEERMHELMGQRYAQLATSSDGRGSARGPYGDCGYRGSMMGGDYYDNDDCAYDRGWMMDGDYDWGPMMGAMMGNWRQMNRDDWGRMMDQFHRAATSTGAGDGGHGGWDTRDVAVLGLALLLGSLLVASLAVTRPWRRRAAH